MGEKHIDTKILDEVLRFAITAHQGVERRGKSYPYIVHPIEAVAIVATITNDQELLAAAALHDVVEDTEYTIEDIRDKFGDRIAELVEQESDLVIDGKSESETWIQRKEFAINRLKNLSYDAKVVAIGDKLSNARAMLYDYEDVGEKLWDKFHVSDPKLHKWHYESLRDAMSELKGTKPYKEFSNIVDTLFSRY